MLQNTFQHLPGVGQKTETALWDQDIRTWDSLINSAPVKPALKKIADIRCLLTESNRHLQNGDILFFQDRLPARQHWRFFPEFRQKAVFLDIETDGLDSSNGGITTIALFDGKNVSCYIHDHNMDAFLTDIGQYDLIITYNGKCFDIPFIERYFNVTLPQAQIDLRYVLAGLGIKGGLKKCESRLGINRGNLADVDGFFAVLLWQEYRRTGNVKALETLLAYNVEDTVNLEKLMVMAYNLNLQTTPFYREKMLALPDEQKNPYEADPAIIHKIKRLASLTPFFSYR